MSSKSRSKTRGHAHAPAPRSAKAGKPATEMTTRRRVKRRQRTAHGAYVKDQVIQESPLGPRRVWGISRPKEKTLESRKGRRRD
jgi:hypothetical protein